MAASALFAQLFRDGFSVRFDGATVRVGPAARVTPALAREIRQNKAELLAEAEELMEIVAEERVLDLEREVEP